MLGDWFDLAKEALKAVIRIAEALEDIASELDHWQR
jgi:hypothetical protein